MLPLAFQIDFQAHLIAFLRAGNQLYWGAKIHHIQATHQCVRQAGAREFYHQTLAFVAHIGAGTGRAQGYHQAACAVAGAAKIYIANAFGRCHRGRCWRYLHRGGDGGHGRGGFYRVEVNQNGIAIQFGAVVGGRFQIQHHAGAARGLDHVGGIEIALVEFDQGLGQAIGRTQKIQCNACR